MIKLYKDWDMNKDEFISKVAKKLDSTKKMGEEATQAVLESIQEVMEAKDSVSFIGFGKFFTQDKDAREAIVPGTKKTVSVPAKTVVKFRVGKNLAQAANQ